MTPEEQARMKAWLEHMKPWHAIMYWLNCRIPNAVKAGDIPGALSMCRLLRFVQPGFADIEERRIMKALEL